MVRTRFLSCVASTESDSFRESLPLEGTSESAQTFATHAQEKPNASHPRFAALFGLGKLDLVAAIRKNPPTSAARKAARE